MGSPKCPPWPMAVSPVGTAGVFGPAKKREAPACTMAGRSPPPLALPPAVPLAGTPIRPRASNPPGDSFRQRAHEHPRAVSPISPASTLNEPRCQLLSSFPVRCSYDTSEAPPSDVPALEIPDTWIPRSRTPPCRPARRLTSAARRCVPNPVVSLLHRRTGLPQQQRTTATARTPNALYPPRGSSDRVDLPRSEWC